MSQLPTHETSTDLFAQAPIRQEIGPPDDSGDPVGIAYAAQSSIGAMIVVPYELVRATIQDGEDPIEIASVILREQLRIQACSIIDDPELLAICDMAIAAAEQADAEDGPRIGAALREQFDGLLADRLQRRTDFMEENDLD